MIQKVIKLFFVSAPKVPPRISIFIKLSTCVLKYLESNARDYRVTFQD